jgi:hypothetical protein
VLAEPASATGQLRIVAIVKGKDWITRQAPMAPLGPLPGFSCSPIDAFTD